MPCDHFMQVNNRKYRNWEPDAEPRQCYIEQDEEGADEENETD
jgi:hypothetical protein